MQDYFGLMSITKLSIYALLITLNSPAFADDLDKLVDQAKQRAEEAQRSLKKNKEDLDRELEVGKAKLDIKVQEARDRNREDINLLEKKLNDLEIEARKQWEQINNNTEETMSKLKAWSTQQYDKAENEYQSWKAKQNFADKKEDSPLSADDRLVAGKRAFSRINITEWSTQANASLDGLVKQIDEALVAESLAQKDLSVVSDSQGNTLLHTLVRMAYQSELSQLEEIELREIADLKGIATDARRPEADRSSELQILAIAYLGDNSVLAGVANSQEQYPFDIAFDAKPRSMMLVKFLLAHDKDGLSAKRATIKIK